MREPGANMLLLLVGDVRPEELLAAFEASGEPPRRVHVVAPALVAPLDWLATADDRARRQAEVRAFEAEWTLAETAEVEGEAGEADPVQAVEDALREFPADEIALAGDRADAALDAALARFGLPVRRLEPPPASGSRLVRGLRELAAGRDAATPFVLFVGVNGALFAFGLLLSGLVLLILWLLGDL